MAEGAGLEVVDYRSFLAAVDRYAAETGKSSADSLNRAMGGVIYKGKANVIRETRKASNAQIVADLRSKGNMLAKIATSKLVAKGATITRAAVAAEMKRIVSRRSSAVAYNKSGWQPAAAVFGANNMREPFTGSVAAEGKGRTATDRRLEAFSLNAVGANLKPGDVRQEAYGAVQKAVNAQVDDMLGYLRRRIEKANNRYGGRK